MRLLASRHTALLFSLLCLWLGGSLWAEVPLKDQPHLRRPIAAAWLVESKLLAVANQRSGSISIVDIEKRKVLAEVAVGERLADVAALGADGWLAAVDEKRHELVVLKWEAGKLQIAQRIGVSHGHGSRGTGHGCIGPSHPRALARYFRAIHHRMEASHGTQESE